MSIKLYIPGSMTAIAKGKHLFEVNGTTVGDCLNQLVSFFPKMKDDLFYETKELIEMDSDIRVKFIKVPYDFEAAARAVEKAGLPAEFVSILRTGNG